MIKPKTEAATSPLLPRAELPDQRTWLASPKNQVSEESGQAQIPVQLSAEVRQRLVQLAREMFGDTTGESVGLLFVAWDQEQREP